MSPIRTLTLSANSLGIYDRCRRAYYNYKVAGRRAVRPQTGLIAGTALHSAIECMNLGSPVVKQEQCIDVTLAETPVPPDDYRQAPYLKDALAAFRAELGTLFAGWKIEEVESQGTVPLGAVDYWRDGVKDTAEVSWEFRRDMVGVDRDGRRWICDYKSGSRNEEAQYSAMKNSGQFLGYVWAWQHQHPDKPVAGVQPVRLILRKPTAHGVTYEMPRDNPIFFQPERIEEWHRHTLRKAQELLSRNPEDPDDWPLATAELGCCRHTYGCCDYIQTCTLKPEDRAMHLASDLYESSDHAHANDTSNAG